MENEIREAVVKFESLLRQQLERQERMEQAAPEKDYSGMKTITVGLIDGDGTVLPWARRYRMMCWRQSRPATCCSKGPPPRRRAARWRAPM